MEQHYTTIFAPSPHLGLAVLTPPLLIFALSIEHLLTNHMAVAVVGVMIRKETIIPRY